MSIWFLIWFLLSFILIGATCWSTIILIQQKQAWREFSKKHGLTFTSNKLFEPASVEGVIEGYNVSFFTAEQQNPDARRNRQLTVMQLNANQEFVDGIASGTSEMLPFLQSLEALTPHDMADKKWNKNLHIRTRHKAAVDSYLTDERVAILGQILGMPNADILVILSAEEGVFRFETSNPLKEKKTIENVIKKLITRVKKLEPSDEELEKFHSLTKKVEDEPAEEENKNP